MFKKLRNSMMVFNMLTVSVIMLTAFAVIYLVTYGNIERENQQRLRSISSMFFIPNRPPPAGAAGPDTESPAANDRFSVEYGVSFVLFVKDSVLVNINSQLDLADSVYIEAFAMAGSDQSGKILLEGRTWLFGVIETPPRVNTFPNNQPDGDYTRIVFLDITNSLRILRTLLITLGGVGAAVLLMLSWISYQFAVRAVKPIEDNYNRQKQFIADASHELRTPLAVISANVDAILSSGEETVESQKEWFDYIHAELKRTGKLVDDLLYLAKSEHCRKESSDPFDFSLLCESVCASMEAVLHDHGKSLKAEIAAGITILADREEIARVLYILLDNAAKYTSEGGEIAVALDSSNDKAILRVTNTGEGIDEHDLPRIFDRFYRADSSRSKETGGFGLGLSIAKMAIENAGGHISAESAYGVTTFTVILQPFKT